MTRLATAGLAIALGSMLPVALPSAASAASTARTDNRHQADREALLDLERKWNDAVVARDVAALDDILADDFLLVWIDGSMVRKAAMLKGVVDRRTTIDPFVTRDVQVRLFGDTAVLTGWFAQTVRLGEQSETNRFAYTDVYRRTSAGWRAISAHATLLKAKPAAAAETLPERRGDATAKRPH